MLSAGCAAYRWHELVLGSSEEREKQAWNAKGKYQARHVEVESTDVCVCGRPLRSSDEVPVMGWSEGGGVLSGFQSPICANEDETLNEAAI